MLKQRVFNASYHLALVESSLVPLTTALFLLFLFSASKAAFEWELVDELDDCRRRKSEVVGLPLGLLTIADEAAA